MTGENDYVTLTDRGRNVIGRLYGGAAARGARVPREAPPVAVPPAWSDPEVFAKPLYLETDILHALTLHGMILLALKHPGMPPLHRKIGAHLCTVLEQGMEAAGLSAPPDGWRAEVEEAGP